jgi:hypothetical protein
MKNTNVIFKNVPEFVEETVIFLVNMRLLFGDMPTAPLDG